MTRRSPLLTVAALVAATSGLSAQQVAFPPTGGTADAFAFAGAVQQFEFVIAEPLEHQGIVTGAPFSAEAVNEFTQTLADGNRIERRYSTSLWRDSQGRTRREQEIALVGRLNVDGNPPRLVTISDPVAEENYTLDQQTKTAHRSSHYFTLGTPARREGRNTGVTVTRRTVHRATEDVVVVHQGTAVAPAGAAGTFIAAAPAAEPKVEHLGTQVIEGVEAEGTRTTMTIPAGAIGNIAPIEVVSERWYSNELQMAVKLTRRDPQSGETVYRLTNISRSEPSPDLFVVPSDYKLVGAER